MARPKGSYFSRLPNGDILNISIWSGKSDPKAEIITAEVRRYSSDSKWETIGRLAIYRSPLGSYSQLPEKKR
jgi:hypothetical protein